MFEGILIALRGSRRRSAVHSDIGRSASPALGTSSRSAFVLRTAG